MAAAFWPLAFLGLLYAANGGLLPYMPVWYEQVRGLNGPQLGLALSVALMARVFTGPIISAWAEGMKDPRRGYSLLGLCMLAAFGAAAIAPNYWLLVAAVFIAQTCWSSLIPYSEAMAVIATRNGPISYGMGRAIGSITFIGGTFGVGQLLGFFGPWAVWGWAVSAAGLLALMAQATPPPEEKSAAAKGAGFQSKLRLMAELLRRPGFGRAIFGAALIQAGHGFFYNFGSLTWLKQGFSTNVIGMLWSIGQVAEIAMLTGSAFLFRGRTPERMLMLGGLAGIVRWSVLALSPPLWITALMQCLHAGSFAMAHVAAMKMIDRLAGDHLQVAQMLYFSVGIAALTGLATLGSGWLYQSFGAKGFAAMALVTATGIALVASAHFKKPEAAARST